MYTRTAVLAFLLAASTFASLAQGMGDPTVPSLPPSPASQVRHANHDHPAIAMRREPARLDPNTFIVQPPAHVEWTNPYAAGREGAVAAVPVR